MHKTNAELEIPIAEPWFSMIVNGEKKEEYREIKPYWISRFKKVFSMYPYSVIPVGTDRHWIRLRNGYGKFRPSCQIQASLDVRGGKPEWGAEPEEEYFVLVIHNVVVD